MGRVKRSGKGIQMNICFSMRGMRDLPIWTGRMAFRPGRLDGHLRGRRPYSTSGSATTRSSPRAKTFTVKNLKKIEKAFSRAAATSFS